MADERVYSLGAQGGTTPAHEVSLSALSFKERQDLQRWILADTTLVEPGLLVLTEEYAAWTSHAGALVKDRLDILALDQSGRTVIIELKRDGAPSDIHLQAITYAAMASRFTIADLVRIHRLFLSGRGQEHSVAEVEAVLQAHVDDDLSVELLKAPRIVLVARSFPPQVTASAVWLNGLGLDVKLVQIRVWKTAEDTVLTSSVVYPVPGAEEFIVEPDRQRAAEAKKEASQRTRARKAVHRINENGALKAGDIVCVREYNELASEVRSAIRAWIEEEPKRGQAVWTANDSRPLRWQSDGKSYSPTKLIREIVFGATGTRPGAMWGTRWWVDGQGRDLVSLAGSEDGS